VASDGAQGAIAGVPGYTVGNAVTVVTGEELRAQQVRHAAEALRSLPGVSVNRGGGFGNLTQVRIRGAEGNQTLVLIDGIEANNTADGEFDFSNLSAEDIERIEVIRGPMSGLYGSNAVGGVINIITRRGQGPFTASLRTEGGSFGTAMWPCARPAAATRRISRSPTIGATATASTSRRSATSATAPASAPSRPGVGRRCCPA
jgi:vitamin B12 transporter